jgi:glycerophosphoryl diester phosphodiesterase
VATLEEVVERFPGVLLNLDLKRTAPEVEPYEALLADEVRRLDRAQSVIVASFHDRAIESFRAYAPEIGTSAATNETAAFYFASRDGAAPTIEGAVALQVPMRFGHVTVVDEQFVAAARDADLALHVWTINDVEEMERLVDLGVDGIISDRPAVLAALLERRGVAWDGVIEAAG